MGFRVRARVGLGLGYRIGILKKFELSTGYNFDKKIFQKFSTQRGDPSLLRFL